MIKHESGTGGRTIGRSGDVVCDTHRTYGVDKKRGFPSLASKLVASKPL
jgi:hypothetical protein